MTSLFNEEAAPRRPPYFDLSYGQSEQAAAMVVPKAAKAKTAVINRTIIVFLLFEPPKIGLKNTLQPLATTDARGAGVMGKELETPILIGDISVGTGLKVETIRYYEREGLISVPNRTRGGHRAYEKEHLQRLSFIRRSRELGFPLNDVRKLLQLADNGPMCSNAAKKLAVRHLDDVRGRIASLKKLEKALAIMTAACEPGKEVPCPILEALSANPNH